MFFSDDLIYIEEEKNILPWIKIFTHKDYRELSDMSEDEYMRLFKIVRICEMQMIKYYKPTKINIASFANMLPKVHIHIIARFNDDEYFPNSVWGEKLRNSDLKLPNFEEFKKVLINTLNKLN